MNSKSFELLKKYVPETYLQQAQQAQITLENQIRILIEKCKIPEHSWEDESIELLLDHLSLMDSNNFSDSCGLGEREGRVFSKLVSRRNYHFSHGLGRSGDLVEIQPKAVGSSIMSKLTNDLVLNLLKISGLTFVSSCLIAPMATGMSLTFCMLSIRQTKPLAKYVLMPRIDQKSCIKSVIATGFTPIIIENILVGDELRTDLKMLSNKISELKPENIACVFSVTSCFAPRASDSVEEIADICKKENIFHLINNAYGLQSAKITHMINQAAKNGRVDIVVQSTDKNLMVPVGGTIIAAFKDEILDSVSAFYPGRASSSQHLDILITLLSMGTEKYKALLHERKECFSYLKLELQKVADQYGEKVLETPNNPISIGLSLSNFGENLKELTQIGSMLFIRHVSGIRVVVESGEDKNISQNMFKNFGSHSNAYPCSYMTAASAIGIQKKDVDLFIKRLHKVLSEKVVKKE